MGANGMGFCCHGNVANMTNKFSPAQFALSIFPAPETKWQYDQ
jgi:hypothetical protein